MKSKIFLFWVWFIASTTLNAQEKQVITMIDAESQTPIIGVTYTYGDQTGVTDTEGRIVFTQNQADTMRLAHISYGKWYWTPDSLHKIVEKQTFYKQSKKIDLFPVTVIAVRNENTVHQKLHIGYQERMEHDGGNLLKRIPSISGIRKAGNYGFDPVFRGYKYSQLNIVMDGVQKASAACPNRMDPPASQMAPNMMQRVEILKGPYALRYGTGIGATVNFVSAPLRFTKKNDLYGRVSSGYEHNGDVLRGEGQYGFSNQRYNINAFAAWSQGNDYRSGGNLTIPADFSRGSVGTSMGLKISQRQKVTFAANHNFAKNTDFPALPMDLRSDETWMFNAGHELNLNKNSLVKWSTKIYGSFVDHKMDNALKNLDPRMLNAKTLAQTKHYGGRTEGLWQQAAYTLYLGADVKVENASGIRERTFVMGPNAGNTIKDNAWQNSQIVQTGLFGEVQYFAKDIKYVLSARLETNVADVFDASEAFSAEYPNPRTIQYNPNISMGASKSIGASTTLALWAGRVQRSASITERYINFFPVGLDPYELVGNPDLKPETNNQVDATLEWRRSFANIQVDIFAAYLQNYISSEIDTTLDKVMPMSPGVRRFTNLDEAFKTGFETTYTQKLPLQLTQSIAIAYTYARDMENNGPLPEIPPLDVRYSLLGHYFNKRFSPAVTVRYVAEQNRVSTQFGETSTPSFTVVDLRFDYRMLEGFSLNTGINNLLDIKYYEHLNRLNRDTGNPIYAPGRNIYFGLSYSFN